MVLRDDKIIPITKLYSTVFIYVLYEYSKRVVQSVGRQSVDGRYRRRRLMLELLLCRLRARGTGERPAD